jgi:hypothetical protein
MVTEKAMSELLKFIIDNFSFLYEELGARFSDSRVRGSDALLVFELPILRLRFANERGQILLDFQRADGQPADESFSFDIVRQLITGEIQDDAIMDRTKAEFVKANMAQIAEAFSKTRYMITVKILHELEKERAKRIFS